MKVFIPYLFDNGIELKYALRSLDRFCPNDGVIMCGDNFPEWLTNVEKIIYHDVAGPINKGNNTLGKLLHCLPFLGEEFIAYMDDIFLLQKWNLKANYYGKLSDIKKDNEWGKAIKNTIDIIGGEARNFETHSPIIYNSEKIKAFNFKPIPYSFCIKSIYADKHNIEGFECHDLKFKKPLNYLKEIEDLLRERSYFSTHSNALNNVMINFLERTYPEKSHFEI